jgi:opacity protein-like surface antigen
VQSGHGALVSTLDGVRGNGGTNRAASFGEDGVVGGRFIGWRRHVNSAVFGLEAEAVLAGTDWTHGADRTFSVKRGAGYGLSAIAGCRLPGGTPAYLRGGVVNADFDTHYDEGGQSCDESANAFGLRAGFGPETRLTGRLSARVENVLTASGDHDAALSTEADTFADAEGQARLGLVWRFGPETKAPDPLPVDFGGFYAGALIGHGALMSHNTDARDTDTLDAERA